MSCNNDLSFFPSNFILQNNHEAEIPAPVLDFASYPRIFRTGPDGLLGKRSFNSMTTCSGEEEISFSDDVGEKKRRLNIEQVKTLEKSFEIGNKLDPERKLELAHALGLKPRQIAIWFQNRRARWKTKQLEKDYDSLHRQIQSLKDENQFLLTQNQKLQAQVMDLKSREVKESLNLNKETEGSCSESSSGEQITVVQAEIDGQLTGGYPPSSFTIGRQFSMTTTMDGQSGLWPWLDQQNY